MELKLMNEQHAKEYRLLRLEALKNHPEAFSSSYEEELAYEIEVYANRFKQDYSYTFGAFVDDQLIGVVSLIIEQKNKLKHRANIVAMYVKKEYRMLGVGKSLMTEAINKSKTIPSIEQVYLSVSSHNEPAIGLYTSLGFVTYGVDERAMKIDEQYFDEDLMVLYLSGF